MEIEHVTESVRNMKELRKLLDQIESGKKPKSDWIEFKADARLDRLEAPEQDAILARMHPCVLRGFKAAQGKVKGKRNYLDWWCRITQHGFHDFAEDCWMKCYDSPHVENYDFVTPYLETKSVESLDAYMVYGAVLGTWEYSGEDFRNTELGKDIQTFVEPLAGTAEFCYATHHFYPDLNYVMFDLDEKAKEAVDKRYWREDTRKNFFIGDALEESTWKQVREASVGKSLAYIGKQSQNFFGPKDLLTLMKWGTTYCDSLILEVSEPYLLDDEPEVDDLTRREMKAAGFKTSLDDDDYNPGNPLTNDMSFRLVVHDHEDYRVLFEYLHWTGWQAPSLVAFAELLDLEALYFHSERTEFLPVSEHTDTSDCTENNTFLLFRKKA